MAEKKGSGFVLPVGASSLLSVFAVLCLTVLALLTLTDVRSDAALANASLESVEAYYAADVRAQELLARLRAGERPQGVALTGSRPIYADYAVAISDTQELRVSVVLDGGDYQVVRWQCVPLAPWEGEDNLQLWTPG